MFSRIVSFITFFIAVWGCGLSTYTYLENKEDLKPVLYSSFTITPKSAEPSKSGPKKVRLNVYISNTGKEAVEVPPIVSVIIVDTKNNTSKEIFAELKDIDGNDLGFKVPTSIEVGGVRRYSTSYSDIEYFLTPYTATVIQIVSGEDRYVSYTNLTKDPKALEKVFELQGGILLKHLDSIQSYPSKFSLIE